MTRQHISFWISLLIGALCLSAHAPACAALDEDVVAKFESGAYEEAAEAATALGDAQHLALAARSLNARPYLEADNRVARKVAKRALKAAEQAIEADPTLVEAHLQAAISYAQRGARMAPVRAFISGAASKARERLDRALEMEPQNAWALSSSAAWHLEVARRGGEGRFGSDPQVGQRQFVEARVAAPDNLSIAYECALRLLAYDTLDWRPEALDALAAAIALEPADAFERAVQARAIEFQAAIEQGREAERAFIEAQP